MSTRSAVIGSGNIGTDLMIKIMRLSPTSRWRAMVGIDPDSDGLARAARLGVPTTADGVDGLIAHARVRRHRPRLRRHLGQGAQGERRRARAVRQAPDRPDPGGDRPLRRPGGQSRPSTWTRRISIW